MHGVLVRYYIGFLIGDASLIFSVLFFSFRTECPHLLYELPFLKSNPRAMAAPIIMWKKHAKPKKK